MSERFAHKKSLGQHFLTSDVVPKWMCDAADLQLGETVLEIGPGTGVLTREILARGATVIALEADERALAVLRETFPEELAIGTLVLQHTDVRELDLSALGLADHGFKVIANIPYYLSGYLFRTLLESDCQPSAMVFLIQKEVAHRIARAEKGSLLALSVAAFGEPRYVRTVSRGHFNPPPNVDSAIIAVDCISRKRLAGVDPAFFFKVLHIGFGQKRKQLIGNLAKHFDREVLMHIFSTAGIRRDVRAEDLPLEIWLQLVTKLKGHTNTHDTQV